MAEISGENRASTASDAANAAGNPSPQLDLKKLSLADTERLMSGADVEVPIKSGGGKVENQESKAVEGEVVAEAEAEAGEVTAEAEEAVAAEAEVEAEAEEEVEGAEEAEAEVEAAAEEEAGEVEAEEEAGEDGKKGKKPRVRLSPMDAAIHAVKQAHEKAGTPITWAQAEAKVIGEPKVAAPEMTAEQRTASIDAMPDVAAASGKLEALTTEIEALEATIEESGERESVFTPELSKATRELARKQAEKVRAEIALQSAREHAEAQLAQRSKTKTVREAKRAEWHGKAVTKWPDAANINTPLGKAVAARIAELRNPDNPEHPILWADSAPYRIVSDLAEEMEIAPKTPAPAAKKVITPPKKVVSPLSGAKGTVKAATVNSPEVAEKQTVQTLKKASLADLDRHAGAGSRLVLR